jgi:hypothetical protein
MSCVADLYLKSYPGRFQLYCGLEKSNIQSADYPQRAATGWRAAIRRVRAALTSWLTKDRA